MFTVEFGTTVTISEFAVGTGSTTCIVTITFPDLIPDVFVALKVNESIPVNPCAGV